MAVVIETTLGDITIDLFIEERPRTCLNFLKLCKIKYYNLCLFHSVQHNFLAQTGDPTGSGKNGESVFSKIHGEGSRFYEAEVIPKLKHTKPGLLSMVNCGNNMLGSQFFITLGSELQSLDSEHCVFGEVVEGNEVLLKLNEVICDSEHRPYQDIRITHTVILDDPFDDPHGLQVPDCSPEPSPGALINGRIAPDEDLNETQGLSAAEIEERERSREARARATILEIVGDLPDADMAPPENVLFVCKLNPVTSDDDLEIIFSRFGKVKSCEVIRDKVTGDSLQYAFVEFEDRKACEDAYFKMDNVLIDDRRIHVDFSQSVARLRWKGKGRGVEHVSEKAEMKQDKSGRKHDGSLYEHRGSVDRVETCEVENQQQSHANDRNSRRNEFGGDKNNTLKESRRHDGDYKHDSRQQERRDRMAARNDKDKTVRSRNDRSRHNSERSIEVYKTKNEEHKRHTDIDKDARCSHSNDESRRVQDVKAKPEQRCRKTEDVKGKTLRDSDNRKCEESQNRHVREEYERCRKADKDARNEEERRNKNVDRNIAVKRKGEGEKRLITQGDHKCKDGKERCRETVKEKSDREVRGEGKKRRHSSPLAESRKKHKRSPSSDTESSSSSDLSSSTTSSCTESSGERSKARHKKRYKRLSKKSKKKLKPHKKSRRRLKKDSDTESLSSDSSDSGSMSRKRNKKKRRWKDKSSEEDSNSEHLIKKKGKKKKKKVATKRKRKSSSSEDSETDDTSSDSEDQKPSRKHHKKVIKKSKKNHTKKKKRKKKRSVRESESDESSCCNRKVCSSTSD